MRATVFAGILFTGTVLAAGTGAACARLLATRAASRSRNPG